jgi:predicted kinase
MSTNLYLIRGLPGSGKTTFANSLKVGAVCSADDYFMRGNEYHFNPQKLPEAHSFCQMRARIACEKRVDCAVANTFSCRWEMEPYLSFASKVDIRVFVVDLFDSGLTDKQLAYRNTHGVPEAVIKVMRERWEHDWKQSNPLPPWERK